MTAGLAALRVLTPTAYHRLDSLAGRVVANLRSAPMEEHHVDALVDGVRATLAELDASRHP